MGFHPLWLSSGKNGIGGPWRRGSGFPAPTHDVIARSAFILSLRGAAATKQSVRATGLSKWIPPFGGMTGRIKGDTPLILLVSEGFHPSGLPKTVRGQFPGRGHSHLRECRASRAKGWSKWIAVFTAMTGEIPMTGEIVMRCIT